MYSKVEINGGLVGLSVFLIININTQTNGEVQSKQREGLDIERCFSVKIAGKAKHPYKGNRTKAWQNA